MRIRLRCFVAAAAFAAEQLPLSFHFLRIAVKRFPLFSLPFPHFILAIVTAVFLFPRCVVRRKGDVPYVLFPHGVVYFRGVSLNFQMSCNSADPASK